jgi:hypothetical protein
MPSKKERKAVEKQQLAVQFLKELPVKYRKLLI